MSLAELCHWETVPPFGTDFQPIPELLPPDVQRAVASGAVVVDGRSPEAFEAAHIPGSLNVPMNADDFAERSHAALGQHAAVIAVAADDVDSRAMAWMLAETGSAEVVRVGDGGVRGYQSAGYGVVSQPTVGADRLLSDLRLGGVELLDVRDDHEWQRGHVAGSLHVPLRALAVVERLLPRTPVVVACGDGIRSATAASVLRRLGHTNVWRAAGQSMPYFLRMQLSLGRG
ncbi:MAG: rhodanese-like domain-containing protein [Gaiellales bacterium]